MHVDAVPKIKKSHFCYGTICVSGFVFETINGILELDSPSWDDGMQFNLCSILLFTGRQLHVEYVLGLLCLLRL